MSNQSRSVLRESPKMSDRTLEVNSLPGSRTTVRGKIPAPQMGRVP
jgi:hypothetical protein